MELTAAAQAEVNWRCWCSDGAVFSCWKKCFADMDGVGQWCMTGNDARCASGAMHFGWGHDVMLDKRTTPARSARWLWIVQAITSRSGHCRTLQ